MSHQPVDVLLLFDRTASMGNVIAEAQSNAENIVNGVRSLYPNSAFGVASLADYLGGETPWILNQDFSRDETTVGPSLKSITLANGVDYPEAYSRALYEARLLHWRTGARKYIVLFGDAPAHDPTFYGQDFGTDRGRDGINGTTDDLLFVPVVNGLVHDSIVVLAVYDDTGHKPYRNETRKGFDFMAKQTGGVSVPIGSAHEVVDIVQQSLRRVLQPAPDLAIPSDYSTWVKRVRFSREDSSRNVFRDTVTITPPSGTKKGTYQFPLNVIRGGSSSRDTVGQTWVTIRVGAANYPWRWPILIAILAGFIALSVVRARNPFAFVRYEGNRPFLGLVWRLAVIAILIAVLVGVWLHAPGNIPSVPATSGRLTTWRPINESRPNLRGNGVTEQQTKRSESSDQTGLLG